MPDSLLDEQTAYYALKAVFHGPKAQMRKRNRIREHIAKQESAELSGLIQKHGIDVVGAAAIALLKKGCFSSSNPTRSHISSSGLDLRNNQECGWPSVPTTSFPTNEMTEGLQNLEAASSDSGESKKEGLGVVCIASSSEHRQEAFAATEPDLCSARPSKRQRCCSAASSICLTSIRLPMRVQHQLFTRVQEMMERACYNFAFAKIPELLQERGWDCSECVELSRWVQLLKRHEHKFDPELVVALGKPITETFDSMSKLRHTVVHRIRIPATQVKLFLTEANSFANLLGCVDCAQSLAQVHQTMESTIHDFLVQTKHILSSALADEKVAIAAARAQLDIREESITVEALRKDKESEAIAGEKLEEMIGILWPSLSASRGATE